MPNIELPAVAGVLEAYIQLFEVFDAIHQCCEKYASRIVIQNSGRQYYRPIEYLHGVEKLSFLKAASALTMRHK